MVYKMTGKTNQKERKNKQLTTEYGKPDFKGTLDVSTNYIKCCTIFFNLKNSYRLALV